METVSPQQFDGVVDTVTHTNPERGFAVMRLRVDPKVYRDHPALDRKNRVTIVGGISSLRTGERVRVTGSLTSHKTYGMQLAVKDYEVLQPQTTYDIERYLSSTIKSIGPSMAKRIVQQFGEKAITILDTDPEALLSIDGIGEAKLKDIKEAWAEQRQQKDLIQFMVSVGLSTTFIKRIVDRYGQSAIVTMKADPYQLAREIDGIGFTLADNVAKRVGIHEFSEVRIRAAMEFQLGEAASGGDCYLDRTQLSIATQTFLNHPDITSEAVEGVIDRAVAAKILRQDGNCIYLPALDFAERNSARKLSILLKTLPFHPTQTSVDRMMEAAQANSAVPLSEEQTNAVRTAFEKKVSVITGGPGVGKTAVTKAIVSGFDAAGYRQYLLAPTGKAADRMAEVIGREAQTIHRLLFSIEKAVKQYQVPIEDAMIRGTVIIDEMSMVDIKLFSWLLQYIHPTSIILFVGDVDQLPSVGPGAVLRDLLNTPSIPSTRLTKIFRQAASSKIITNAHAINNGEIPVWDIYNRNSPIPVDSDMWYMPVDEAETQAMVADWCFTTLCPAFGWNPVKDCMVLTPMRKNAAGVDEINKRIQKSYNPNPSITLERPYDVVWGVGDRVMQTRNNYDLQVFNGDQGIITHIEKTPEGKFKSLMVDFGKQNVEYKDYEDINDLTLSYAFSIHKSQGSEAKMVVICIHKSHYVLLKRNLLYTAITRGKQKVILIGNGSAVHRAISDNDVAYRATNLSKRIELEMKT